MSTFFRSRISFAQTTPVYLKVLYCMAKLDIFIICLFLSSTLISVILDKRLILCLYNWSNFHTILAVYLLYNQGLFFHTTVHYKKKITNFIKKSVFLYIIQE